MTDFPSDGFRQVLTALDLGETDVIVTPDAQAAQWAGSNGYRLEVVEHPAGKLYEIYPGDTGPVTT